MSANEWFHSIEPFDSTESKQIELCRIAMVFANALGNSVKSMWCFCVRSERVLENEEKKPNNFGWMNSWQMVLTE